MAESPWDNQWTRMETITSTNWPKAGPTFSGAYEKRLIQVAIEYHIFREDIQNPQLAAFLRSTCQYQLWNELSIFNATGPFPTYSLPDPRPWQGRRKFMLELLPMNSRTAFTRQYFQKSDQIRNELNIGKDELKANPNIRNFVAATTQKRIWEATPHLRFHGNFPGRPYPDPRGHCGCRSLSQISAPPPQASPTRSPIIASTTATAASDSSNASPNSSQSQRLTSTPHATGLPAQSLHDAPRLAVNEQSERAYQHLEKPCSNVTPVRTTEAAAGTKHYHPESVSLPQQNKRRRLDNAPAAASARLSKGDGASLTVVPPADDDKQEAERRAIRAKRFGVLQDDSSGKLIDLGFSRATVTVATKATAACCNPPPATIPTSVQTPQEVDLLRSLEDLLDQCQPVTQ